MSITIKGCRTNNLKDISLEIPKNKITCVCGPSGSGKSSLVFHTLANESKRRFLNSMPSDLTFFDRVPQSADVDLIEPVLPVWVLAQNNPIVGSRLNLGDQLELTTDIASLYFDPAPEMCPIHQVKISDGLELFEENLKKLVTTDTVVHFFIDKEVYGEGISGHPVRSFDLDTNSLNDFDEGDRYWEIFRVKSKSLSGVIKKLKEFPFLLTQNSSILIFDKESGESNFLQLTKNRVCLECLSEKTNVPKTIDELIPFNGVAACSKCSGYGSILEYSQNKLVKYPYLSINDGAISILNYSKFAPYLPTFKREVKKLGYDLDISFNEIEEEVFPLLMDGVGSFPGVSYLLELLEKKKYKRSVRIFLRGIQAENTCTQCDGSRVNESVYNYKIDSEFPSYGETISMSIDKAFKTVASLNVAKDKHHIKDKILEKLGVAIELGLGPYDLTQKLKYIETNEYQKSLLVRFLSFKGTGSLFVLDEPSLGLNDKEQKVLIKYLKKLAATNTVVLVDHSKYIQKSSDLIVEMGPLAGHLGGEITYQGKYRAKKEKKYEIDIEVPKAKDILSFKDVEFDKHTVKEVKLPVGTISTVTSHLESFSKKAMINVIANDLYMDHFGERLDYDIDYSMTSYSDLELFDDIIIYQTNVDRASGRSTVGTMLGLTPIVRKYFANLPVSKNLGLKDGHFSPNSELGKCSVCEGKGVREIDMQFLEDVTFVCDECDGKKLNKFYANISDGKYTVHDAYNTPLSELFSHLPTTPKVKRIVNYLKMLNLDYLTLDRSLPSLSGGERLRVKFLNTLQKNIENSLLVFTNISYGLSGRELGSIKELLLSLCSKNNTVVLIDNHPDFSDFNKIEIKKVD